MQQFSIIGNLGRDAEVKNVNGRQFVSFTVGCTDSWVDSNNVRQERTTWYSCVLNGDGGKLLPFLRKGKKVFVQGEGSVKLYSSAVQRQMMAGANISVRSIELLGGDSREVPSKLYLQSGEEVQVNTAFWVDMKYAGVVLYSRTSSFGVDQNGFVTIIQKDNEQGQAEEHTDINDAETF